METQPAHQPLPAHDEMVRAMLERDTTYDGVFYTCVKTTGIFCRPACTARKPKPKNIEFHASVRDCLLAGYRPCLRCKPLDVTGDAPNWLDQLIAKVEDSPSSRMTDQDLQQMGVSSYAVRRYFQRNFGFTFQAYHRARRMGLALKFIQAGGSDLRAAMDHGFESLSGFRDAFQKTFGVTPMTSQGVACIMTRTIDTPVGPMVACATDEGVCLLEFADRRAFQKQVETLKRRLGGVMVPGINDHLEQLQLQLQEYFLNERTLFTVPLIAPGTDFQKQVWDQMLNIPMGQTLSYEKLATNIDRAGAQRAVGRASGDNRLAILIPCHRVVRSDGSLCGYGGGLWRKHFLLNLERTTMTEGAGLSAGTTPSDNRKLRIG